MTAVLNDLHLAAEFRDERTVLSRVRADGLWRASRPFREGAATRIVLSHLGPGLIHGDVFASTGTVSIGSHLIVAGQMATRVLPGAEPGYTRARWDVGATGVLEIVAQPVIVTSGAAFDGHLDIALGDGARAIVTELIACDRGGSASTTMHVRRGSRSAAFDALRLDAHDDCVGTLSIFGACGRDALDRVADAAIGVRVGVGRLRDDDLIVRLRGSPGAVRAALTTLRAAVPFAGSANV